jgi:hypothetical protein
VASSKGRQAVSTLEEHESAGRFGIAGQLCSHLYLLLKPTLQLPADSARLLDLRNKDSYQHGGPFYLTEKGLWLYISIRSSLQSGNEHTKLEVTGQSQCRRWSHPNVFPPVTPLYRLLVET